jgi:hypothetical protein
MAQQIHPGDPAYAPPLIRPPSPASSIGTVYGPDDTSLSDVELDDAAFARKTAERLRLTFPSESEMRANRLVLLPRHTHEQERNSVCAYSFHHQCKAYL